MPQYCVKTRVCSVAINWDITLILQPARSDAKISLARAHENRLKVAAVCWSKFVLYVVKQYKPIRERMRKESN